MARRYHRRRKNEGTGTIGMLILLVIGAAVIYLYSLPADQVNMIIGTGLAGVVLVACGALLVHIIRLRRAKQKLRALSIIDAHYMDGFAFEKYVAELMKSQGYSGVQLTERYDYGIDIIATKNGVRWGVQVKRHRKAVKAEAVRQVVTALNKYRCQRAMVVTNSVFSRPARVLAESNNCVLIGKDQLAQWIIAFQKGD